MTKKRAVALSIAGLFSAMFAGFLFNSAGLFWLGVVLFVLGMAGLLIGAMWLWRSVLAFFATIAVLTVLLVTTSANGPRLWFSAFGELRTDCQVLDATVVTRTKSSSYTVYTVQCGDRRIDYEPYRGSEYIGDVGERTSLMFDRTGLMKPLRSSGITGADRWAVPGAVLLGLLYIWLAATVLFAWSRRKKPLVVDQEFT
ncbi:MULTISPECIES: hypothetical protein [Saccharothrix]|uniref:hypothetical protein n=1 Tax=Saccharothrix TaxID=2071 RepID=UPI00093DD131|nr:hypothetical protein [Saccharothrix sp. CB00851]OKI31270.1 hypothetical protein A6A25_27660 [Saccharothrix sp. CB00851]